MLTAKNLERIMELEAKLREEYQGQLDAKDAEIERCTKEKEEKVQVIEKQLEQIKEMSGKVETNKRTEQHNRELKSRSENLQAEVAGQKKRIRALQQDLAEERAELKTLKQFDPAKMKKSLDANKKKLAEKTSANETLQKAVNRAKNEKAELQLKIKELEAKIEELEPAEASEEAAA